MGCLWSRESSRTETPVTSSGEEWHRHYSSTRSQYIEPNNRSSLQSDIVNFQSEVFAPTRSYTSPIRTGQRSIFQANTVNVRPSISSQIIPNTSPIITGQRSISQANAVNVRSSISSRIRPSTTPITSYSLNPSTRSNLLTSNVPTTKQQLTLDNDVPYGCKKLYPSEIRYMQDSIASTFFEKSRHGGVKIGVTLDDLLKGRAQIKNIPRITVCHHNGQWFSSDNRRLWVFKKYEAIKGPIQIIVNVTSYFDENKFTTINNGTRINVRGDPGGIYWKSFKDRI